jgi:hypothetical protein
MTSAIIVAAISVIIIISWFFATRMVKKDGDR